MGVKLRPIIGITTSFKKSRQSLDWEYVKATDKAGAIPLPLPILEEPASLEGLMSQIHGLIFTGGPDLLDTPLAKELVAEERKKFEEHILDMALGRGMPILGICYGMQFINYHLGGTLYEDLPTRVGNMVTHDSEEGAIHPIEVFKDTILYSILKRDTLKVNSYHHDGVKDLARGLRASAKAPDGVIEAMEPQGESSFLLCFQWHPEREEGEDTQEVFRALVKAAIDFKGERERGSAPS